MQTFTFKCPDGSVLKRKSATRTYTHAIIYKSEGKWVMGSCVGCPDMVAARLETWGKGSPECIAVPAT